MVLVVLLLRPSTTLLDGLGLYSSINPALKFEKFTFDGVRDFDF